MRIQKIFILFFSILLFWGCSEKYTPKPRGYFRINFPEKAYRSIENEYPYSFEIPVYSAIEKDPFNQDKPNWINVTFPENKAEIHLSYFDLDQPGTPEGQLLNEFLEESHELAYKHTIKADAINEQVFMNPAKNVYGLIYRMNGNAASPMQFYLTDSTRHFLRGAFYIREVPNIDSIQPVIDFIETDIVRLIETTTWN